MTDMLWEWTGWVAAAIATMFAVRGSIRFDVNQWLKDRRKQREENLRQLCPHIYFDQVDGKCVIRSAHITSFGTTALQCQICGDVTHDEAAILHKTRYWAENPAQLNQRVGTINKLVKKLAASCGLKQIRASRARRLMMARTVLTDNPP